MEIFQVLIVNGILAILFSVLTYLLKRGLNANEQTNQEAHNTFKEKINEQTKTLEKIQDKWENFLKDNIKAETIRGNKIDAMFRIVDTLNETVKQIRSEMGDIKDITNELHSLEMRIVKLETIINGVRKHDPRRNEP